MDELKQLMQQLLQLQIQQLAQPIQVPAPPQPHSCACSAGPACLDPIAATQYQHTMVRYNDQSSAAAGMFHSNLMNQQAAITAGMLRLTADITGSGVFAAAPKTA